MKKKIKLFVSVGVMVIVVMLAIAFSKKTIYKYYDTFGNKGTSYHCKKNVDFLMCKVNGDWIRVNQYSIEEEKVWIIK